MKVSVLMPVYNAEQYLRQAVDSILHQSFTDFEFIIIDDGSSDSSPDIINSYKDTRIRFVVNEQNIGITKSLNKGLNMAQGEYIARMDADDISLPQRLARQVAYMDSHPETGVLGTAAKIIDSSGAIGYSVKFPEIHHLLLWVMCWFKNPIIHPSVMYRRLSALSLGGYDGKYPYSEDYYLWSRMIGRSKIANLKTTCLFYRKHDENISTVHSLQQKEASLYIGSSLISRILNQPIDPEDLRSYCTFLYRNPGAAGGDFTYATGVIPRLLHAMTEDSLIESGVRKKIIRAAQKQLFLIINNSKLPIAVRIKKIKQVLLLSRAW